MCPYGWGAEGRPHQPKIAPKLNYTPRIAILFYVSGFTFIMHFLWE